MEVDAPPLRTQLGYGKQIYNKQNSNKHKNKETHKQNQNLFDILFLIELFLICRGTLKGVRRQYSNENT